MATCEYRINGVSDPTHNEVFNYISNTSPKARSAEKIKESLVKGNIVFQKQDASNPEVTRTYLVQSPTADESAKHIQNLNTIAQESFNLNPGEELVQITNKEDNMQYRSDKLYSVEVNQVALRNMTQIDFGIIESNKKVADEVVNMMSGPASPFSEQYQAIREARESQSKKLDEKTESGKARIDSIESQIVRLKQAFAKAGINVTVEFDESIESKGEVASKDGVPVVKLNPNLMSEDTTYHEFAHIYVDLLGYNNPIVQNAINQLKGTELYKEVKARYPELTQEQLDKEVLVTAIGLEGARIQKKNPSKVQQVLNRLFRALGRLLGVSQASAATLAQEMFVGELQTDQFRGALADYVQKSKAENRVEKALGTIRVKLQTAITKLEATPNPNRQMLADLKLQKERLEKVQSVEDLISFVNYVTRYVAVAEATMENVENNYSPDISEDERLRMMSDIQQIHEWLVGFYGGKNSAMEGLLEILEDRRLPNNGGSQAELDNFIGRLTTAMRRMKRLEDRYLDNVVPMQADLLLQHHTPKVNDSIDNTVETIRRTGRTIGLKRNTKEFRELRKLKRRGDIDAETYNQRVLDLNIEQLKSRRIGRETLINELRDAQKNKSYFSMMLDPLIYSSQTALQLFTKQVKSSMYKASEKSRQTKYRLRDIYREYAATRQGLNDAKFNEPIIEEHTYYVTDWEAAKEGRFEKKKIKVASFVQPIDTGKYNEAEYEKLKELSEKYKRPTSQEELKGWQVTPNAKNYYKELNKWYAENTVPVENAQKEFSKLLNKLNSLTTDKNNADKAGNVDLSGIIEAQMAEVQKEINSVYSKSTKTFRGRLAKPSPTKYKNPKYDKLVKNKNSVEYRYYQAMLDEYKGSQSQLGKTNQVKNSWDNFSYALPTIRKSALDKSIENGAFAAGKDMLQDSFQIMETDTEYGVLVGLNGERLQTVPVFFTNPVDEKDVSRDVIGSVLRFGHMSNMFEEKSRILSSVESMRTIIEERGTIEQSSSGIPGINQAARRLSGMQDRLVKQDKARNPDLHLKHLNEFIDSVFYGEVDLKNNIKKTIDVFGREINVDISGTKVARAVSLLTSVTSLAGNHLQGVNQAIIDNERLVEEAVAGQFFGPKNLAWANAKFAGQFATLKDNAVKDIKSFAADNKMVQAAELFDAFQDVTDRFGMDVSGNRAKKFLSLDSAFAYQNAAEYQTAMVRMLALMDSYTGKLKDSKGNVIKNEKGKDANVWDVLVKNKSGAYEIDSKVANFNIDEFRNVLSGVQKKTNQLKGQFDRAAAERRAIGKMVMIFRKYLVPGLRRRFGHGGTDLSYLHVDTETGTVSQGMYVSFLNFLGETGRGILRGEPNVWKLMSKDEKSNIVRTTLELGFGALAFYLYGVFQGLAADADDEDEAAFHQFMAYQFRRLNVELRQFRSQDIFTTLESPTAAVRPLSNTVDLISHLIYKELPYAVGARGEELEKDIFYSRKSGKYDKGDRKLHKKLERAIPIWSGLNKDAAEAIKWFDLNE